MAGKLEVVPIRKPLRRGGLRLWKFSETQQLIEESRRLWQENRELRLQLRENLAANREVILRCQTLAQKMRTASDQRLLLDLSRREQQVLALIAEGYATKQVAHMLKITFKTAVHHRTRLMQKLDIHEVAGLTRFAIRSGLVQP